MANIIGFFQDQPRGDHGNIIFSKAKSEKRINKANQILGTKVVNRIIGFALFLLGLTRKDVIQFIDTPYETFNSFIRRIWMDGISAFQDRRLTYETQPMTTVDSQPPGQTPTAKIQDDEVIVHLPSQNSADIRIPSANKTMVKAVLLTLLQNQIVDSHNVADILGCTQSHILYLNRQILSGPGDEVLFDHRQGQKQCYVFKPEVKAELIQQCSANAIVGKSTSSEVLASSLKKRCGLELSKRSIRHHIQKLGLKKIAETLPQIIEQLKKNSGTSSC